MSTINIIKKSLISVFKSLKTYFSSILSFLRDQKSGTLTLGVSLVMTALVGTSLTHLLPLQSMTARAEQNQNTLENIKIEEEKPSPKIAKKIKMIVTAYSSTVDQTDDTPFITASGKYVKDGIVANNMLPFGTKIRIPELYGDKIFVVEDRMHKRKSNYHIDIWFPTREMAKEFGVKLAEIEILED